MNLSYSQVELVESYAVGNVLRKEGIEKQGSFLDCSEATKKGLGNLITKLQEKLSPYVQKAVEYEVPTLSVFAEAIKSPERFSEKALSLATKLYETGDSPQIQPFTLLVISFAAYTAEHTDGISGLALLAFSSTRHGISLKQDQGRMEINSVDILDEDTIDRVAVWYEGTDQVWVREKKSVQNQYWVNPFLQVKPIMTDAKAAALATKMIKKVSSEIASNQESSAYRDQIKTLVDDSAAVSFDEIEQCSKQYIDDEKFDKIKKGIEKQSSIEIIEAYEMPADILEKKVKQFVKTMRLTPDLDVTFKGKQEVLGMEQLPSDEDDVIVIKLRVKGDE